MHLWLPHSPPSLPHSPSFQLARWLNQSINCSINHSYTHSCSPSKTCSRTQAQKRWRGKWPKTKKQKSLQIRVFFANTFCLCTVPKRGNEWQMSLSPQGTLGVIVPSMPVFNIFIPACITNLLFPQGKEYDPALQIRVFISSRRDDNMGGFTMLIKQHLQLCRGSKYPS